MPFVTYLGTKSHEGVRGGIDSAVRLRLEQETGARSTKHTNKRKVTMLNHSQHQDQKAIWQTLAQE